MPVAYQGVNRFSNAVALLVAGRVLVFTPNRQCVQQLALSSFSTPHTLFIETILRGCSKKALSRNSVRKGPSVLLLRPRIRKCSVLWCTRRSEFQ